MANVILPFSSSSSLLLYCAIDFSADFPISVRFFGDGLGVVGEGKDCVTSGGQGYKQNWHSAGSIEARDQEVAFR